MDTTTEQKLINIYKDAFINSYEEGGGYGFRFHHGVRVMTYCKKFLELDEFKNANIDKEALFISALFHDIGKVKAMDETGQIIYGSEADRDHARIGSEIVHEYVGEYVSNPDTMKLIEQILIESDGSTQTTTEAMLVKDADRLDNYGYQVVWRHITGTTYNKRTDNVLDLEKYWIETGARDRAKNYLDQFNFDSIRKIGIERYNNFNLLIEQINREINGEDIITPVQPIETS